MSILVILGCNDERGHFDGRLGSARIGSMEFVAKNWLGPRLKFLELTGQNPRMRLFRRDWPIVSHREWVGNWCCDGIHVRHIHVAALLNCKLFRRAFTMESAHSESWDHWHAERPWREAQVSLLAQGEW